MKVVYDVFFYYYDLIYTFRVKGSTPKLWLKTYSKKYWGKIPLDSIGKECIFVFLD